MITAQDVAGNPDLYNGVYRIGRGRKEWECMGLNRAHTMVHFARIEITNDGIRQINIYVKPDQVMHIPDRV